MKAGARPEYFVVWVGLVAALAGWPARVLGQEVGWQVARVPGAWESNGPPAARSYDGLAWYRAWLKPHDSFFTRHERNLFEESVAIYVRDLADAHEVFVNGTRIGGGGSFPPAFQSGRSGNHRHKVPPGLLRRAEWNEIAIRVYNAAGPGGFLGEAPFVMDYFNECVLEGDWEFRLGDDPSWKGPSLRERPARAAFDRYHESSRVLGRADDFVPGPRLPPAESAAKLTTSADLKIELLLHEPLVAQPTHLSFDARGRLWVAQYRQYPYPAGVRMLSRDKYYRAQYDKVPPPPPHHDRGRDLISIHEDTDGDGVFDRHKVFVDGLNMANAVLPGSGGVWVMHTPYLLFYPDRDGDDVPDGPPVVHLAGFGLEDTHSVANGLVWGPDGWIYGAQGSTTSSRVTRPGLDRADAPGVYFEGCMVWRYHPKTRRYEIFAEGTGNIFGLEFDGNGELFSGHNGAETRGWHYLQGAYYMKQGVDPGKFGPPRNPYAYGELPWMKSLTPLQRFSHTLAVGEGTALPRERRGQLFFLDPVHSLVVAAERQPRGSTFQTRDWGPVVTSADEAFRPVYIVNAPDGSLFVADFYEHYIAHGQHYQSQIDPTTGRIYRLRGRQEQLEREVDLTKRTSDELIALLGHPNKWHRRMAGWLLGARNDRRTNEKLRRLVRETAPGPERADPVPLGALWALQQAGALDDRTAGQALRHGESAVRRWTVRLLGDRPAVSSRLAQALAELALAETNVVVRAQLAATARRLPAEPSFRLLLALLHRDEDAQDPCIPLLRWWALETHLETDSHRAEALGWFRDPALWRRPLVREQVAGRLMKRLLAGGRQQDYLAAADLLRMAPSAEAGAPLRQAVEESFRGRPMLGLPESLLSALAQGGRASLILRLRQGEPAAVEEALEQMSDPASSLDNRVAYARAFGEVAQPRAVPELLALAEGRQKGAGSNAVPISLRAAALAALGSYQEVVIGRRVTEILPRLPAEARPAALALLTSREPWSLELLQAIQEGRVRASLLSSEIADRLRSAASSRVRELALRLFPPADPVSAAALRQRIARVEAALRGGPGNPYPGELLFTERCAGCHKLFFKGGNIGPDLTSYQRDHLGTMLTSILNPSAEIREGYDYMQVETSDGRSLGGFLAERDARLVVLRGLDGQDVALSREQIRRIEPMGRSLMPEGLLDDLSDEQLRDLFAFLRSAQPFTR